MTESSGSARRTRRRWIPRLPALPPRLRWMLDRTAARSVVALPLAFVIVLVGALGHSALVAAIGFVMALISIAGMTVRRRLSTRPGGRAERR